MTTEEMLEEVIQLSQKAYKKNSKGSREWLKLQRHEDVIIDGVTFNYWREYAVYKVCEYLKEKCPNSNVECFLEGNNSYIKLSVDDKEQQELNNKLFVLLKNFDNSLQQIILYL